MILSMETFKEILVSGDVDDPGKLPIIFLKDVPYCDLESLIQYIYNGKVVLTESQSLASFTQLARTMGISGKYIYRSTERVCSSFQNNDENANETTFYFKFRFNH